MSESVTNPIPAPEGPGSFWKSRKFWSGIIAGVIVGLENVGAIDADTRNLLLGVVGAYFGGVTITGAARDFGLPPTTPPPGVVKAVVLGLVLSGSLLACAGTSCAEPMTAPADVLDLAQLQRAATGRQNDAGAAWPSGFRVRRPVVVFVVEEVATGDLYLMDPEELAAGRAGLHPWLVAVGRFGTVTTSQATKKVIEAEVRERLRLAMQRAAIRLATQLPAALSGSAPAILRAVLTALAGAR